jgi:hypothetical protein
MADGPRWAPRWAPAAPPRRWIAYVRGDGKVVFHCEGERQSEAAPPGLSTAEAEALRAAAVLNKQARAPLLSAGLAELLTNPARSCGRLRAVQEAHRKSAASSKPERTFAAATRRM